jgi:hypothetical protein
VVGEEDVKYSNEINKLRKGEGIYAPLKANGYFERRPHPGPALLSETVRQPAGNFLRDLGAVALADAIERFPDDLFQFVEVDDVGQLAGVRA